MQAALDAFFSIGNERLSKVELSISETAPETLSLSFETKALVMRVNEDDDTIEVFAGSMWDPTLEDGMNLTASRFWAEFIGLTFGWGWVGRNQQGYCDLVLLSFGGISPQVLLEAVASSLKTRRIKNLEVFGTE